MKAIHHKNGRIWDSTLNNTAQVDVSENLSDTEPDWNGKCEICGDSPIVPATGMCGPCTFGEAETIGGNW